MPYSLDQLEFLSAHMGVAVPALLLEKKRGEAKPIEPKKAEPTTGSGSLVALQQSRLAWDTARKQMQTDLKDLEADILAVCGEDEEVGVEAVDIGALHTVLDGLDSRLIDKLDAALNAADPAQRAKLNQEAKTIAGEYMTFINGNALMADIDDSGFKPVSIRKSAVGALDFLASKL